MYPDHFSTGCETYQMIKERSFRISVVTLILFLCLGSLVTLPMLNVVGLSVPEVSEVELGNYNLLDQIESDEEIFIGTIIGMAIAYQFFSKSRPMNLDFQTATLSPASPPPKHS